MLQEISRSRRSVRESLSANRRRFPVQVWILALIICIVLVVTSFLYVDLPVARKVYGWLPHTKSIGAGLSSVVLLSIEAAIALGLMISRIVSGRLSPFREATALACLTSICAHTMNDSVVKILCGVPPTPSALHGSPHVFHFLAGSGMSSFPSGHMALAGGFAGVFMRLYRGSTVPLAALLLVGSVLLVIGDWHFVSDVIAGTFLGVSAGILAGELWLVHWE